MVDFELPIEVHAEDTTLVVNVITALNALQYGGGYKVEVIKGGYILVRAVLEAGVNEVDSDDLHVLLSVSPSRIERVAVHKTEKGELAIVVRIVDHTHRVMVTGMATFVAVKKRRLMPS